MATTLDIGGIAVEFPFEPYECQIDFMRASLRALINGENALLESPTGTGKTLCLVCSTMAFRMLQKRQAARMKQEQQQAASVKTEDGQRIPAPPRSTSSGEEVKPSCIIYASRTHSQLAQVAKEIRATAYKPVVSSLGSRENMCIHESVSKLKGNALNHACNVRVANHKCRYRNNMRNDVSGLGERSQVMDIEELVAAGREQALCPYYISRRAVADADLILMPYNYLLDPRHRRGLNVDFENSVVIFDEAHNIESNAADAASYSITSVDVATAVLECDTCIEIASQPDYDPGNNGVVEFPTREDLLIIKSLLLKFEQELDAVPLDRPSNGTTKTGLWLVVMLEKLGVTAELSTVLVQSLNKAVDLHLSSTQVGGGSSGNLGIQKFMLFLQCVFRAKFSENVREMVEQYRVYICKESARDRQERDKRQKGGKRRSSGGVASFRDDVRVLNFWCCSPGIAMTELKALGVRSILLASGTLSPLASFAAELQIPFNVRLENPHIVKEHQVWAAVVPHGVTGQQLTSKFEVRERRAYKQELGLTIVNMAKIVPAGLLVFFASYTAMDSAVSYWKSPEAGGLWDRLTVAKPVVMEPRSSVQLADALAEYEAHIDRNPTRGAMLFAVCRGKVSEGIDFADHKARGVIITGIPYAPPTDPKVQIKRDYLVAMSQRRSVMKAKNAKRGKTDLSEPPLSGDQWYQQQAIRSVNQAVGRVLRHRNDWGCVIFCEDRFGSTRNQQGLSRWLRPFIKSFNGPGPGAAPVPSMQMMFPDGTTASSKGAGNARGGGRGKDKFQFGSMHSSLAQFVKAASSVPELNQRGYLPHSACASNGAAGRPGKVELEFEDTNVALLNTQSSDSDVSFIDRARVQYATLTMPMSHASVDAMHGEVSVEVQDPDAEKKYQEWKAKRDEKRFGASSSASAAAAARPSSTQSSKSDAFAHFRADPVVDEKPNASMFLGIMSLSSSASTSSATASGSGSSASNTSQKRKLQQHGHRQLRGQASLSEGKDGGASSEGMDVKPNVKPKLQKYGLKALGNKRETSSPPAPLARRGVSSDKSVSGSESSNTWSVLAQRSTTAPTAPKEMQEVASKLKPKPSPSNLPTTSTMATPKPPKLPKAPIPLPTTTTSAPSTTPAPAKPSPQLVAFVTEMKTTLDAAAFKEFKRVVKRLKGTTERHSKESMQSIADDFIGIFRDKPEKQVYRLICQFVDFVPKEHKALVIRSIDNAYPRVRRRENEPTEASTAAATTTAVGAPMAGTGLGTTNRARKVLSAAGGTSSSASNVTTSATSKRAQRMALGLGKVGVKRPDPASADFLRKIDALKPSDSKKQAVEATAHTCMVCTEVAAEALIAKCGHIACRGCWSKWRKSPLARSTEPGAEPGAVVCPSCRATLGSKSLRRLMRVKAVGAEG